MDPFYQLYNLDESFKWLGDTLTDKWLSKLPVVIFQYLITRNNTMDFNAYFISKDQYEEVEYLCCESKCVNYLSPSSKCDLHQIGNKTCYTLKVTKFEIYSNRVSPLASKCVFCRPENAKGNAETKF